MTSRCWLPLETRTIFTKAVSAFYYLRASTLSHASTVGVTKQSRTRLRNESIPALALLLLVYFSHGHMVVYSREMMIPDNIKRKLREIPDKPGVYFMRDKQGKIIYVGKAASLRSRVQSYFRQATLRSGTPKTRGLVHSIKDFDILVTRTEAEATLTEGRLIKEYRPRYNVSFKDDKRFLLIRVDLNEPWPRFDAVRIRKEDGASYFGPYASTQAARAALEFMDKRFGLRRCRPREPGSDDHRHCLNDIVRFCSAPCILKVTRAQYMERVATACDFLRGGKREYLRELEAAMEEAARKTDFEKAAALRDTLLLLRQAVRVKARGTRSLELKEQDAREGIRELQAAFRWDRVPAVIEAYDISNISGTHAVGSLVCAEYGLPARNRYRMFRIKTIEGSDDPGMMSEVLRRRFSRGVMENEQLPDLVLVDGGITQLRAAKNVLGELGLDRIPSLGLAKRFEELYWIAPGEHRARVVRLPADSAALKVLQRLRDEAHRFALTYHRNLRGRRIRESRLDEIQGIGEKRKQLLLHHFGSLLRLMRASESEIAEVPGVGPVMAQMIYKRLHASDGDNGTPPLIHSGNT